MSADYTVALHCVDPRIRSPVKRARVSGIEQQPDVMERECVDPDLPLIESLSNRTPVLSITFETFAYEVHLSSVLACGIFART